MPDQPQDSSRPADRPQWGGWATGMTLGLLAVIGLFYGMTKIIHEERDWARAQSAFQVVCANQRLLLDIKAELKEDNDELRESNIGPRPYPAPALDFSGAGLEEEPEQQEWPEAGQPGYALYTCENRPPAHDPAPWHSFLRRD